MDGIIWSGMDTHDGSTRARGTHTWGAYGAIPLKSLTLKEIMSRSNSISLEETVLTNEWQD